MSYRINAGQFTFSAIPERTIKEAAWAAGIAVPSTCGGNGKCLSCRCKVVKGKLSERSERERAQAEELGELRLACQSVPLTNVELAFEGPLSPHRAKPAKVSDSSSGITLSESRLGSFLRTETAGKCFVVPARQNKREGLDRALLVQEAEAANMSVGDVNRSLRAIADQDEQDISAGRLRPAPNFGSEGYDDDAYHAARRREKLLYFNIEFTNHCNLACIGCFAGFGDVENVYDLNEMAPGYRHVRKNTDSLTLEELFDVMTQAADLGARTVDLIGGGEPLGSRLFFPLIEKAVSLGLHVEVFTNGTLITPEIARHMAEYKVLPFVKLYSARSWVHDEMVGTPGAWEKAVHGLEHLLDAGYGGTDGLHLSLESIVVSKNAEDIAPLWRLARETGMIPYFERFVGCHYDGDPGGLLSALDLKRLWEDLWLLDRGEYGFTWPLLPLRVGYTCATNFYSLYINFQGDIRPCSGTFIPLGNIRDDTLQDILKTSPVVQDLREFDRPKDSWCAQCFYYDNDRCPGCRGMAMANGGYMADDPLCFHNTRNLRIENDPRNSPHLT